MDSAAKEFLMCSIAADIQNLGDVKNPSRIIEKFGRSGYLVDNTGIFPKIKQCMNGEGNKRHDVNLRGRYTVYKGNKPICKKHPGQ